jgi:hypothetical protein
MNLPPSQSDRRTRADIIYIVILLYLDTFLKWQDGGAPEPSPPAARQAEVCADILAEERKPYPARSVIARGRCARMQRPEVDLAEQSRDHVRVGWAGLG